MPNRILSIIALFLLLTMTSLSAQEVMPKNWNIERIKGARRYPYPYYSGKPFLTDKFVVGEIEFPDGVKIADLQLRYSKYRDELIYYNPAIPAQIIIDKISLRGFSMIDSTGRNRLFRQQYYDGYSPGNRFFEILVNGEISLLAFRKTVLEICPSYLDIYNRLNNMTYRDAYIYYLYDPKKGYDIIKIHRNSLLSKFDKPNQKLVKKALRKNSLRITDELSFVKAWNLILENRIPIMH